MKIHLATDHAGLELKNKIQEFLISKKFDVIDHGAYKYDALDDYPDFIFPCAKAVADDKKSRGIIWVVQVREKPWLLIGLKE